jgi:hypothetical protein
MDLGAVFLLLAVLLLVALYVAQPLFRRAARLTEGEHRLSALLAEKDRLLNALQELDFDFSLGKVNAGEYPGQRTALLQAGADILRQIDQLAPAQTTNTPVEPEERLEAAIAARRLVTAPDAARLSVSDEDLEERIAKRRSVRMASRDKVAGFCPRCGKPVLQSDAFCPACGAALK